MARRKVILQAPRSVIASEVQLNQDAVRLGNAVSGVVFVDVFTSVASGTVFIDTCSTVDATAGALGSWVEIGSTTMPAGGAAKFPLSDLGDAIRWRVGSLSNSPTIALTVFLCDQS